MNLLKLCLATAMILLVSYSGGSFAGSDVLEPQKSAKTTENFQYFLRLFFLDTEFQKSRVLFPLYQIRVDEDGDFLEKITAERYLPIPTPPQFEQAFEIVTYDANMPAPKSIVYSDSQSNYPEKIVQFRGIENGIHIEYRFKLIDSRWMLFKIVNSST